MSDNSYDKETKASVMAALIAGQSVSSVAREYNIPKGTVSNWKRRDGAKLGTQKNEMGDLILSYLKTNLAALKAQAEVFSDPEWLMKQEASQLAVLHGVMTDKAIRLLESLSSSNKNDGQNAA